MTQRSLFKYKVRMLFYLKVRVYAKSETCVELKLREQEVILDWLDFKVVQNLFVLEET